MKGAAAVFETSSFSSLFLIHFLSQVDGRERYFTVDQFIDYNEQKGCGEHVVKGVLEAEVLTSSYNPAESFLGIAVKGTFINTTLDSIDGKMADF